MADTPPAPAPDPAPHDPNAAGPPPQNPPQPAAPPKRRRWLRRTLLGVGALIVLLLILVLILPALASTGWARSVVVGKVNDRLNGRLQVDDWSLGWTSGVRVSGVRIFDAGERQVLQLANLTTHLTLLDLIRGKYHAGQVVVDGLDVLVEREPDGTLNWDKLYKSGTKPAEPQKPAGPEEKKPPEEQKKKLPDVSGELIVKNSHVTYSDGVHGPVNLDDIQAEVKCPDINQPITDSVQMGLRLSEGIGQKSGTVSTSGTIAAVQNNIVSPQTASVDQKVQVHGLDLATLKPFLGPDSKISTLGGLTDVQLAVQVQSGTSGYVEGQIRSTNFAAGGEALSGDTFRSDVLTLVLPRTSFAVPTGTHDLEAAHVRVGSGHLQQPLTLKFAQGVVKVAMDSTPAALQRFARNQKPGAPGRVQLATDVDIKNLANDLKNTLKLVKGVELTSGKLSESLEVQFTADQGTVAEALHLSEVTGRNTQTKQPISLRPIDLSFGAISVGGEGKLPDLRDLSLKLSGPITADVSGKSLAELRGKIEGALDEIQRQVGQVVDMGDKKLSGTFAVLLDSQGDLGPENGSAKVRAEVTLNNLHVSGVGATAIDQPSASVVASATLLRGKTLFIEHVKDASVTARSGEANNPTLDAQLTAAADYQHGKWMPTLNVPKLLLNLRQAQSEFGAFIPALEEKKLRLQDGTLSATAAVSYDGKSFKQQGHVDVQNLTLAKGDGQAVRQVLKGYTLGIDTAGAYMSEDGMSDLKLTKLDIKDNQGLVQVSKAAEQDVAVTLPKGGSPAASGKIHLAANLKGLNDVVQALQGPAVVATDQKGSELRSGNLAGDVELAQADPEHVRLTGNFAVSDITIAGPATTPIQNESITIALQAVANHDASVVQVPQLSATGDIVQVTAKALELRLKDEKGRKLAALAVPRKGDVQVTLPSLSKIQMIEDALTPQETSGARAAGEGRVELVMAQRGPLPSGAIGKPQAASPKVKLVSGSATIGLNLSGDGNSLQIVPVMDGKDIAFRCGQASYTVGPVQLRAEKGLTLALAPAGNADASVEPSTMRQIRRLQLPALHVTAIGSDISLVEPIDVTNPGGLEALLAPPGAGAPPAPADASANGRILVRGNVGPLKALLDALKGEPPAAAWGGGYAIDQQFKTVNNQITANGRMDLNELTIDGQASPERAYNVLSNIVLDAPKQTLTMSNVSVLANTTKALTAVLKGTIADLSHSRRIDKDHPLTVDLSYDAAMLWTLIVPTLTKEAQEKVKDWQVAGKYRKQFVVTGAYPAGLEFYQAMRSLSASGGIQFDHFAANGATLDRWDLPLAMTNGIVRIAYAGKPAGQNAPPPATLNGGTMDLSGFALNLTQDHPRLTTPPSVKFLDRVQLNPVFASNYLGWGLNNPAFVGANQTTGILNATIVKCDGLALDSALTTTDSGHIDIDVSIQGLKFGNPTLASVLNAVKFESIQGDVKSYRVTIDHGITHHDLTLDVGEGKRPFKLFGDVRMADREMLPVTINLPWELFRLKDQALLKYLPAGIEIPLRGKVETPQLAIDINQVVQKSLLEAGQKALQDRLLGGGKNQKGNATQPADQNPVDDILNDIFNQKKKDKKRKPKEGESQQPQQK